MIRSVIQCVIEAAVRPYVVRELPGWGRLSRLYDHRWDWLWANAPKRTIRDKLHGNLLELNLAHWWDRNNYFLGRWYDLEIQLVAQRIVRPGDTVVDVGANRGEFTLAVSRLAGKAGRVICFDPNPNCIALLEHHLKLNGIRNVTVHNVGLGDEPGELTLNVPVGFTYYGTFGRPPETSKGFETLKASVAVGDVLLADETPKLVKIDVEGFEYRVLRGMEQTLKNHHPVVITEHIDKNLRACGSSARQVENFMHSLGYTPFHLGTRRRGLSYEWTASAIPPDVEALDAIWIHTNQTALFDDVIVQS